MKGITCARLAVSAQRFLKAAQLRQRRRLRTAGVELQAHPGAGILIEAVDHGVACLGVEPTMTKQDYTWVVCLGLKGQFVAKAPHQEALELGLEGVATLGLGGRKLLARRIDGADQLDQATNLDRASALERVRRLPLFAAGSAPLLGHRARLLLKTTDRLLRGARSRSELGCVPVTVAGGRSRAE